MLYREIDHCRSCGSCDIPTVLDLGMFAISDFLELPDAFVDRAPLELVRCADCTLVQLRHTVDRDRLYRHYWYRSATQPAMVRALRDVAHDAAARVDLRPGDVVIDIGANDGTLLRQYETEGLRRIAYEPAENLWPLLKGTSWDSTREIAPIYGYFPMVVGGQVVGCEPKAKVITSIACFYDVDDPKQFIEGIRANLDPDGMWINQLAYLPDTMRTGNFGDFCHEHLTYWTGWSFDSALRQSGLRIDDFQRNDVNGGSIRFIVGRNGINWLMPDDASLGWQQFSDRMLFQRGNVRAWLRVAQANDVAVIGYGASTKGNTYLQYWDIGPDLMPYIADRNPDKIGKYTPTGQKIISEEQARAMKPDYFFVLPWHFLDAFIEREHDFLMGGGQFVVPFPELRTLGGEACQSIRAPSFVKSSASN